MTKIDGFSDLLDHSGLPVVVLAGGKGTRLWPLSSVVPKALVPINGIPIVRLLTDFFKANNHKRFIFCIGHKGDCIRQYFSTFDHSLDITYVDSGEDADILERIKDCRDIVSGRFFVCYGDTLANVNLGKLLDFHNSHKALVTMTLFQTRSPFGLVFSGSSGLVREFKEKPLLPYWMNIGYMVFEREALELAGKGPTLLEFFDRLISMKKLCSYKHTGLHYTFNTETERQELERNFHDFYDIMTKGVFHER